MGQDAAYQDMQSSICSHMLYQINDITLQLMSVVPETGINGRDK